MDRPIVGLLPSRNAAEDLPGWLESAGRLCDAVVALDDGSTDATPDLLDDSPLVTVILRSPPPRHLRRLGRRRTRAAASRVR